MLFQHELDRECSDYWNLVSFDLRGRADCARWQSAWKDACRHFPLLRARYRRGSNGHALQILLRDDDLDWRECDLRGMDSGLQAIELREFEEALAKTPDLRHTAPLRLGTRQDR